MPSRTKIRNAEIATRSAALPKVPVELLDQLTAGSKPMTAAEINVNAGQREPLPVVVSTREAQAGSATPNLTPP